VEQVSDKGDVDMLPLPLQLFEKTELVEKLLGRMLVAAVPGIDKRGPGHPDFPRVFGHTVFEPAAYPFDPAADYEHAGRRRIAHEHLDGIGNALFFLEAGILGVEVVQLDAVKFTGISEGLFGSGTVLHEEQVHPQVGVVQAEGFGIAAAPECFFELTGLLIEVPLFIGVQVPHHLNRTTGKSRVHVRVSVVTEL
jgi:hypothetical protein